MYQGLKKTAFDINKKASLSDQSDHQLLRRPISLKEKRLDLEMLKEKNQNLEICYAIKEHVSFWIRRILTNQAITNN